MTPAIKRYRMMTLFIMLSSLFSVTVYGDVLANKPLYLQSDNSIEPNIMFTIDDSGSMGGSSITDSGADPSGTQASDYFYNKIAYNPNITYIPWVNYNSAAMSNTILSDGSVSPTASFNCTDTKPCVFYANGVKNQIKPSTLTYSRTNRSDCANNTSCTFAEEQTNYVNWKRYYNTRMKTAKASIGQAFSELDDKVRVGFGRINNLSNASVDGTPTNTVILGVRKFTSTNKTTFFDTLYNTDANGSTPLRRAMDDVGIYFSRPTGSASPWADTPGEGTGGGFKTCRQSYHILMTDGYWNTGRAGIDNTSPVRRNNDGDAAISWPQITSADGKQSYQYVAARPYADTTANLLADVAMYYWARDLQPNISNKVSPSVDDEAFWQHMVNLTLSFGARGNMTTAQIDAAKAGTGNWPAISVSTLENDPTNDHPEAIDDLIHAAFNSRGNYYTVKDPSAFVDSLKSMFSTIQARNGSSSATVSNTARLSNNTRLYQASFNSGNWSGELAAYAVTTDGTIASTPSWQASSLIPSAASRAIYTRRTSGGSAVLFSWNNLDASQQTALNSTADGTADGQGQNRLNWVRGDQSLELQNTNGIFRTRSTLLGDIINSSPVLVSNQDYGVGDAAFTTSKASRTPMIYVGANDGMLHGIRESDGVERFAYIPAETVLKLNKLTAVDYPQNHLYLVDGSPRVGDAKLGSNWKTVLLGSTGAGGKTIFALDVTAPDSFGTSNALWEYSSGMGYTIPQPTMGQLNGSNWVAIAANGYEDAFTPKLMVLNLQTGALVRALEPATADKDTVSSGTMNGLSTPIPVDLDGDRVTDLVYAGDLQGNLWRFDLRSSQSSSWTVSKIFTACTGTTCSDTTRQPITARPMVIAHPNGGVMVLFGTGSYFRDGDRTSTQLQTLYGVWDKLDANPTVVTKNQLVQQTIVTESTATSNAGLSVRVISNNEVNYNEKRGWYLNLMSPSLTTPVGERVITDLQLREDQLVVTTMLPSTDPCDYGGKSWLLEISPLTGSRLGYPVFDINGDGTINDSDNQSTDNGTLPVSGKSFDEIITKSTFVEKSDGKTEIKYASGSSGTIKQTLEVISPSAKGRQSWRQLQ